MPGCRARKATVCGPWRGPGVEVRMKRPVLWAVLWAALCLAPMLSAGRAAAAQLPEALASAMSVYPGAETSDIMYAPGTASALLVAEADLDQVLDFYRADLAEHGFTISMESRTVDSATLQGRRGDGAVLTLGMLVDGDSCQVRATIVEQDGDFDMGAELGYPGPLAREMPLFPGAEVVDAKTTAESVYAFLQIPGDMESVYDYYHEQLLTRGWTPSMLLQEPQMSELSAVRGGQALSVDLGSADDFVLAQITLTPGVAELAPPEEDSGLGDMGSAESGARGDDSGGGSPRPPAYPASLSAVLPLPEGGETLSVSNMMDTLMVDVALDQPLAAARDYYFRAMQDAGLHLDVDMMQPGLAVLAGTSAEREFFVNIGERDGRTMVQIMASPRQ